MVGTNGKNILNTAEKIVLNTQKTHVFSLPVCYQKFIAYAFYSTFKIEKKTFLGKSSARKSVDCFNVHVLIDSIAPF